jgi:spore coat protein U-like protein
MKKLASNPSAGRSLGRVVASKLARLAFSRTLLIMLGLLWMCQPSWADKGSCNGGADSVVFGTLSLSALQNATGTGDLIAGCPPGLGPTATWDFCASIGVGTNSVSQTDRRMTSGSNYISYQLYTDSARSNPYQYLGTNMVAVTYTNSGTTFDIQYVYGKILSSGAGIPPGTYTDSYTVGTQASISNDSAATGNPALECTGASGTHNWNTTAFNVNVTLQASCSVTATPLSFGTVGVLTAAVNSTTNLSVACTYTTPYTVSLGPGNAPGATTTTRAMTLGASKVNYSLFQNAGMTQNWGNNIGVDTVAGTGTGAAQSIPVYGQVPAQTTPTIGAYSDTVLVTVNY